MEILAFGNKEKKNNTFTRISMSLSNLGRLYKIL